MGLRRIISDSLDNARLRKCVYQSGLLVPGHTPGEREAQRTFKRLVDHNPRACITGFLNVERECRKLHKPLNPTVIAALSYLRRMAPSVVKECEKLLDKAAL